MNTYITEAIELDGNDDEAGSMQQINPKVVAAYRKAQSAAAKLTVSENAYGNVSATHTPQQLSAATRAARRLSAEIRAAYPGATVAQEIEIRQRLQAGGI